MTRSPRMLPVNLPAPTAPPAASDAGAATVPGSRFWLCLVAALLAAAWFAGTALAQEGVVKDEEEEIPPPKNLTLRTADNVVLHCTYYGSIEGPKAAPVIIIHGWGGQRLAYDGLALQLQEAGHAVIVPDLRGHGGSKIRRHLEATKDEDLDPERFGQRDMEAMYVFDLEAVKWFLYKENNAGKLNLDALCVIGADEGTVIALNWINYDWSQEISPYESHKSAHWAKACVLISPHSNCKGLATTQPLRNPVIQTGMNMLIVVGEKDRSSLGIAARMNSSLERLRARRPKTDPNLFFLRMPTTLQGVDLLGKPGLNLGAKIRGFINLRLMQKMDEYFPWRERQASIPSWFNVQ